jgi:methionine-S-sulfoxide reductase
MRIATIILSLFIGSHAMATTPAASANSATQTAIFAGGCFWCMQPAFDNLPGVVSTAVGYTGGSKETANYAAVSRGTTHHVEAIQVTYDPRRVAYETLLQTYWENIDPTDANGQFADKGAPYHTAIFVQNNAQQKAAEQSKTTIAKKFAPAPIAVKILPAQPFYAAEDYHQQYYLKNKNHYELYKHGSGRAGYLEKIWGKKE